MPTDIYIDAERLEGYGETCSTLAAPRGKMSLRRIIPAVRRDVAYIIKAAAAVERFLASPSRPPRGFVPKELEWLTDNAAVIEKEGKALLREIRGAPRLPAVKSGTVTPSALRLAEDFLRSGQNEFSRERLELFLNGVNRYRRLYESELWLFVPLLKRAAISAIKTESYRIMKALDGYLFNRKNNIFSAEAEFWQLLVSGRTPKNLTRNLAGDAQSVHEGITARLSNAIKALKVLTSEDFIELICRVSAINAALMRDPAEIYPRMTAESQAYCRMKSEIAARHARKSEEAFANQLVEEARRDPQNRGVCGQIDEIVYFKRRRKRLSLFYIFADTALPILLSSAIAAAFSSAWLFLLLILPMWELSRAIVNYVFLTCVRPDMVHMLELKEGIPKEGTTLVAIALLVISKEQALSYVKKLKRYQIANRDAGKNVVYTLLADFPDSKTKEREEEKEIIEAIKAELDALNKNSDNPFGLICRPRVENAADGIFMGWERKRGAVLSLLSLIRTGQSECECYGVPQEIIRKVKYLVCLDSDTELMPSSLKKMVGAALHPQNRPVVDRSLGRVVSGYGILQPKISVSLDDANATEFARIYSGQGGIDPYCCVCGEIYQDLFADSIFIGKGIIDVEAMHACLENAIPDNRVLSHDLLEGGYLRVGFLSMVELPDGFPAKVSSYFKRAARWVRGDVQLSPWLFSKVRNHRGEKIKNPLSKLTKFKIRDNLRRAETPLAALACISSYLVYPSPPTLAAAIIALLSMSTPVITNSINRLRRMGEELTARYRATVYTGFLGGLLLLFSRLLLLPYEVYVTQRSIITSLYRMLISKRKLLEWVTAAQAEKSGGGVAAYFAAMWPQAVFAAAVAVIGMNALAIYMAALWVAAPLFAAFISRRQYFVDELSTADRAYLLEKAGAMWSWFEDNLTSADSYLIPDNTQKNPDPKVAHRTSPTNIGFSMLAAVSACELGFITPERAEETLSEVLYSVEALDKYHGHLYNWYNTKTRAVLRPATVSSVDSGNLVAALYAVSAFLKKRGTPRARALARKADALIKNADFSIFCDYDRLLLRVSINAETGVASDSFYDMMASEARLTSFVAIAKGDLPKKHWEKLSRALVRTGAYSCMLSWSGSMFEYLMPELLMTEYKNSLIYESNRCAVWAQMKSASRKGVPWGISESGYYDFDRGLSYRYAAHGTAELGCKRGLENDLVVSPYSTYLALVCDSSAAVKNLRALDALGVSGRYGHYEAIDFTENRASGKKEGRIVESFMAHHMGMSLCAVANALTVDRDGRGVLQRYFDSNDEIAAFDALLKERIPLAAPVSDNRAGVKKERKKKGGGEEVEKNYKNWEKGVPPCALLANGEMSLIVSAEGKMISKWRENTLYCSEKFENDLLKGVLVALKTNDGLKVEKSGIKWSEFNVRQDNCSLISQNENLKITHKIAISAENSAEIHEIFVENRGETETNCDLCVYFEPILGKKEDYLSHPEYFRLFLSGEKLENGAVITRKDPKTGKRLHLFALSGEKCHVSTFRPEILGRWDHRSPEPLFQNEKAQSGAEIREGADEQRKGALSGDVESWERGPNGYAANNSDENWEHADEERKSAQSGAAECWENGSEQRQGAQSSGDRPWERGQSGYGVNGDEGSGEALSLDERAQRCCGVWTADCWECGGEEIVVHEDGARESGVALKDAAVRFLYSLTVKAGHTAAVRVVLAVGEERRQAYSCALRALALQRFSPSVALAEPPMSDDAMDMLSRLIYPKTSALPVISGQSGLLTGLWELGISGDLPIVLFDARREADDILISEIYKAAKVQDILEKSGFLYDLVFICDEKGEYKRPVYNICLFAQSSIKGGDPSSKSHIFVNDVANLSEFHFAALKGAACLWLPLSTGEEDKRESGEEPPMAPYAPTPLPPLVHSQPLAGKDFGCLTCDVGVMHTWYKNSRLLRLTPWENDPLAAAFYGENLFLLLKDKKISVFMAQDGARSQVVFGQGYTAWHKEIEGLQIRTECFIAGSSPLRLITVEISGFAEGEAPEMEWRLLPVLGEKNSDSFFTCATLEGKSVAVTNPYNLMYKDAVMRLKTYPDFREGRCGRASSVVLRVKPEVKGQSAFAAFALWAGEGAGKHLSPSGIGRAREEAVQERISQTRKLEIQTPNKALDNYINDWSAWQIKGCRLFSRSSFYQNSGGYGFRDQIQDASALLHTEPELLREQILRCCLHQYEEGDVQHWWHTLESEENVRHIGVRTTCSDDYMWLVWAVGEYVRATGDRSILYEEVAYLSSKPLESGEHERYEWVCVTETKESVLEHCARAAELFIKRGVGAHGLPLVLGGDWNDSMNRMGEKGRGESVWLAWFGALSLKRFAELLEEGERRERYSEYAKKLVLAAENVYNGEWYPRGYDDGGLPVGSPENEECKIDSISQSFAVFAGADRGRARRALENALKALVDDENRIIKLFSPPFEKREGMGYIASYPPGVRENGGQYTHAAIWMASACFKAGMAEWGYKLLDMLLPQNRDPAKYRVEPFVLAADVYSQPPLAGQGGWSWYTGAAGWYRETVINDLLGITLRGGRLFIKPNIPSDWPGFECAIRYGGALYQISVSRGAKQSKGIEEGILLIDDGEIHEITVSV